MNHIAIAPVRITTKPMNVDAETLPDKARQDANSPITSSARIADPVHGLPFEFSDAIVFTARTSELTGAGVGTGVTICCGIDTGCGAVTNT